MVPAQRPGFRSLPVTPAAAAPPIPRGQRRPMSLMMTMSLAAPHWAREMQKTTAAAMRVAPGPSWAPLPGPPLGQQHRPTRQAPSTPSARTCTLSAALRPVSSSRPSSFNLSFSFKRARHEARKRLSPAGPASILLSPAAALRPLQRKTFKDDVFPSGGGTIFAQPPSDYDTPASILGAAYTYASHQRNLETLKIEKTSDRAETDYSGRGIAAVLVVRP